MIRGICGLWGNRTNLPSKVWDTLTGRKKIVDFPSPTSPDPVDGVNRSKFNFFPEQHQHKPTTKTFVPGQRTCTDPGFFVRRGGGVQAPQLILQFTEGVQWLYYTFSRGVQLFPVWGGGPIANFYRNPYNYNL